AVAAFAFALHPALVGYTPALMTEGTTASLLAVAAWLVVRSLCQSRGRSCVLAALAFVLGLSTLVRPQSLLLAPFYGLLALRRASARARALTSGAGPTATQ